MIDAFIIHIMTTADYIQGSCFGLSKSAPYNRYSNSILWPEERPVSNASRFRLSQWFFRTEEKLINTAYDNFRPYILIFFLLFFYIKLILRSFFATRIYLKYTWINSLIIVKIINAGTHQMNIRSCKERNVGFWNILGWKPGEWRPTYISELNFEEILQ